MNNDKVAIVTITYNAEDVLEETILSIINQSYKNIEYIVIDGASTDGTIDIIKKYEDKINYWISEPDEGIYFAMNKAIEKATGEWINFMNAGDTFFDLDTVEYVMKYKTDSAELLYGNYKKKKANLVVRAQSRENWFKTMPFNHQTLFTKALIMKENPFNTKYRIAADHNFIVSMFNAKKNFYYFDKTLAIFVEDGFAHNNTVEMCIESIQILLDNNVDIENIYASSWYKYLNQDKEYKSKLQFSNMFLKKLDKQQEVYKQLTLEKTHLDKKHAQIIQQLSKITKIRAFKSPIQKFKAYKKLLSFRHQQNKKS